MELFKHLLDLTKQLIYVKFVMRNLKLLLIVTNAKKTFAKLVLVPIRGNFSLKTFVDMVTSWKTRWIQSNRKIGICFASPIAER